MLSPFPPLDDYRSHLREAGFRSTHDEDLTKSVLARTFTELDELVQRERAEFDRRFGIDLVDRFALGHMQENDSLGYHAITAVRHGSESAPAR